MPNETELERSRVLGIVWEHLTNGFLSPCSPEFADGYSCALQELYAEINRPPE